jgi:capsular exopolysaccharide synthesis family protein
MDSKDRPEPNVPALPVRRTMVQPVLADPSFALAPGGDAPGSLNIGKIILQAFVHHWWKILAIWVVLTAGLAFTIHVRIKPLYETYSMIRVEPAPRDLFGLGRDSSEDHFLMTQVVLLKSNSVLGKVAESPSLDFSSPGMKDLVDGPDVESGIRKRLLVEVIPDTYMIRIAMNTPYPVDAAKIINEVVKSYVGEAERLSQSENKVKKESLEAYANSLKDQIEKKKEEWLGLAKVAKFDLKELESTEAQSGGTGSSTLMPRKITLSRYRSVMESQFQVTMDLIEAEALLSTLQAERKAIADGIDPEKLVQQRVQEAFFKEPDVAALLPLIERARRREIEVASLSRSPSDPSRAAARRQLRDLQDRLKDLWKQKREALAQRVHEFGSGQANDDLRELSERIATMRVRKNSYDTLLKNIVDTDRQQENDAVKEAFIREDLSTLQDMRKSVDKRIEQLHFDALGEARINLIDPAKERGMFLGDSRNRYMLMTPFGVFATVLGLFLLLELRSGRVADLDEVSRRVPVEVYALPSLPGTRRTSDQKALRSSEAQLQEFLQGLDHLRVSLWYGQEPTVGVGRCLAITSAIGGEGKTTLSSHLAVCCAKAGISTLVIDADLRRAALSRMFEEEQSLGLSDVLKGDVSPEQALLPLRDGGFHLLSAGTPGQHPGWLFREQRIGQVLERYRQMFDLVIIDTPPVLPVPDALSLGRWVDGTVLVIRYDLSRFALVERARRRLISAGIPILKTVVNGVKTSRFGSGSGGGYNYGYGYSNGYSDRTPPAERPEPTESSSV